MSEDVSIGDDENLEELFSGRLKILQKKDGYRFSIDAILLAHFASRIAAATVIDLGTGSGIIPLILARKTAASTIVGVEVQAQMVDMARRTIALNSLTERVTILSEDVRSLPSSFPPSSFDLVVSNPPYYPVSAGRVNPRGEKAIARHEIIATLGEIVGVARYLVKPSGRVLLIIPARRLSNAMETLGKHGLTAACMQVIYSHHHEEARLVTLCARKGGNPELKIEEPFYIYETKGVYSREMLKIYAEI